MPKRVYIVRIGDTIIINFYVFMWRKKCVKKDWAFVRDSHQTI